METKYNERIVRVTSSDELAALDKKRFHFTAAPVYRIAEEDFTDESTGETKTIERNYYIFGRGHDVSPDNFSQLLFYFQSNELKEVVLSDQKREGYVHEISWRLWKVKAVGGDTKLNMLLHAPSVVKAYEIVSDYIELNLKNGFVISGISLFQANVVIERNEKHGDEKPNSNWYSVSALEKEVPVDGVSEGEDPDPTDFIVFADSVETAKEIIEDYIAELRKKEELFGPYEVKILSAKVITCNVMIPVDFCLSHKEESEEE